MQRASQVFLDTLSVDGSPFDGRYANRQEQSKPYWMQDNPSPPPEVVCRVEHTDTNLSTIRQLFLLRL